MFTRRQACLLTGALALTASRAPASAQAALAAPADKAILTVTGKISVTNQANAAAFDRAMLENFGLVSFETMTPWYTSKVKFEGIPMIKLLKAVGATGDKLSVVALNDYKTEIPVEDFEKFGTILAIKRDGQYMPVSDKGPLFIVYPYDSNPELKTQKFYSRSAWQVAKIEVK
jgi:hypothetical protein